MVKALVYLEEQGELELRAAGVRQGYRVIRIPDDRAALWHELRRRFAARERSDIARVSAVADLLGNDGCLVRRLLAYFGEELGRDCGHCGACDADSPVALDRPSVRFVLPVDELERLRAENPRALGGTRQIARFLCGLNSPALAAAKLTRHPRFGSTAKVPFAQVVERVKAELAADAAGGISWMRSA